MDYLFYVVFFICLFLYLHVIAHYRKGEDLELFETDYAGVETLQDSCNLLQPLLVLGMKGIRALPDLDVLMDGNRSYNGSLRDMEMWRNGTGVLSSDLVDSMMPTPLPMSGILGILSSDSSGRYVSEGNAEFLEESGYYKKIRKWGEEQLAPRFTLWTKLDVWMGGKGACTPLRYHSFYRQFLVPRGGLITVKLSPWKSRKYLHPFRNDLGMENLSPIVPWGGAKTDQVEEREKLKFLEVVVPEGRVLYLPPYWWYSVEFSRSDVVVYSYTYISPMNWLANSEIWLRYLWASRGVSGLSIDFQGSSWGNDGKVGANRMEEWKDENTQLMDTIKNMDVDIDVGGGGHENVRKETREDDSDSFSNPLMQTVDA